MRSSRPPISQFRCLFLLLILFSHSAFVHAEVIHGTAGDDTIVVVSGTSYDGIISYEGDDVIFIESGAEVASDHQFVAESIADALAVAIDAGGGDDQVTTSGSISATADATALHLYLLGGPYRAKAHAYGIWSPSGANMVQNLSEISVLSLASEA